MNTSTNNWDMGFFEMLEETPDINPKEPTQFSKIPQADGAHIYLIRPDPSWSNLRNTAA